MKILRDGDIEKELCDMFSLSEPEESEDGEESEEDDVPYNATKLQQILGDLEEPNLRSTATIRASLSPQPSTSSDAEFPCGEPLLIIPPPTVTEPVASSSPVPLPNVPQPTVLLPAEPPISRVLPVRGRGRGARTERRSGTGRGAGTGRRAGTGRGRGCGERGARARLGSGAGHEDSDSSEDNAPPESEAESEASESDRDEEVWKKTSWTDMRPQPESFDSIPMTPKRVLPTNTRPIRYFEKFFTDEVFELIITETNRYASQNNVIGWTILDIKELKAFLGILIIMGYNILPTFELYWSSDPEFRVDEIASTMTFRRFKQILRCLHLNDNAKQPARFSPEYDKLFKIRPLLTLINTAFQENAHNSSSQSIDESMILFKGRSSLKQYMPMKPIKRGFKVWCRCDSSTGYLYEFEIYTGKDGDRVEDNLGGKVVTKLTEKLKGMAAVHVTFDNFFCGYDIMNYLHVNGISASATVRRQRADLPKLVKSKRKLRLTKGQYKWRVKENVAFVIWQDTKEVLFMTNAFHPMDNVTSLSRKGRDGSKTNVVCPAVVKEYTKRMGGVDQFDHIKGTYSVGRRSKRWWLRIFYFIFDACITNSFLLQRKNANATKLSNLEYRIALARGLIGCFSSRKRRADGVNYVVRKKVAVSENYQKVIHIVAPEIRFSNVGDHMPNDIPSYQRCRYCSTKAKDKRSKIKCSKCGVPLCITPCFTNFHKEM